MEEVNQKLRQAAMDRHAVRKYLDRPIENEKRVALLALADEINAEGKIHAEVVFDEPKAFKKSLLAYGMFKNVRNYIVLAAGESHREQFQIGYQGQRLALKAQELGLNTCWVALSFSRKHSQIKLKDGEKIWCVLSLGYGVTQGVQHKMKPAEKICPAYASMPEWFKQGVDLALLAPTAMNELKFHFELAPDGKVKGTSDSCIYQYVDLGIASLQFEIGSGVPVVAELP